MADVENDGETIEELKAQLDQVRKAQAGSDRQVTQLQQERDELRQKLYEQQQAQPEQSGDKQSLLDRKQKVWERAIELGQDPQLALRLLGLSEDDDDARLDALNNAMQDAKTKGADEMARKHGRKVREARLDSGPVTYEDMLKMSDRQISEMSPEAFKRAVDSGKKPNGTTRRQQILQGLGGK
jgi:chromosome segregation ATPase